MKRTRWLLIALLVLASASCARRDWVSDMLTLADVTGTWTGASVCGIRALRITFRQSGSRVTGTLSGQRGAAWGDIELEGVVNGDVLRFTGRDVGVEATVDGDEMTGLITVGVGFGMPIGCNRAPFHLRRESSGRPGPEPR